MSLRNLLNQANNKTWMDIKADEMNNSGDLSFDFGSGIRWGAANKVIDSDNVNGLTIFNDLGIKIHAFSTERMEFNANDVIVKENMQIQNGKHLHGSIQVFDDAGGTHDGSNTIVLNATTTAGNYAVAIPDGEDGQTLNIIMTRHDGGDDFVITPANFGNGLALTFNEAQQFARLVWTITGWNIIGYGNPTAAGNPPVLSV